GLVQGAAFAAPWEPAAANLLFTTRAGALTLLRLLLAALTYALARSPRRYLQWAGWTVALGLLLAISLGSHAAAQRAPFWPVLMDWLHLLGAAHWAGGLVFLLFGLRAHPEPARLVPRFTRVALASV